MVQKCFDKKTLEYNVINFYNNWFHIKVVDNKLREFNIKIRTYCNSDDLVSINNFDFENVLDQKSNWSRTFLYYLRYKNPKKVNEQNEDHDCNIYS